jgi:Thymidine kinase
MPSMIFTYATMNSGKSSSLIQVDYNYKENNMNTLVLTPEIDNRAGVGVVSSRVGISVPATTFKSESNLFEISKRSVENMDVKCILVDEAQFLKRAQVEQLARVVDELNTPVMAYGLRTDSFGQLFEGSAALFALADELREMRTVCRCMKKATMVLRKDADGNIVKSGAQIAIGGNDLYTPVCRKHFFEAFK